MKMSFQFGFIGLLGPTNSGKSSLVNALVGSKVSIVSPLPQTTYRPVRGILSQPKFQLVFVDTPGMQNYPQKIPRLLNTIAARSADGCDLSIWVFDSTHPVLMKQVDRLLKRMSVLPPERSLCVLNKIDLVRKPTLLPLMGQFSSLSLFSEILPLSAKTGDGVKRIIEWCLQRLPHGSPLYAEDILTERSERFLVEEFVREKIYCKTRSEIPYSVRVEVEDWSHDPIPVISAVIHVDSVSRKGILIGKGGAVLKAIGSEARRDVEVMMGKKVCLKLHVGVDAGWTENQGRLREYLEC